MLSCYGGFSQQGQLIINSENAGKKNLPVKLN